MEPTFENRVIEALARIEQRQEGMHEQLLEPGGRIPALEKDVEDIHAALSWNDKKQWIHSAVIVPVTGILVGAARKLGLI